MSQERFNLRVLKTPAILMLAFWAVAIALWLALGNNLLIRAASG
jgi:hypothetical protein